jgi:cbb3-type cytochrome oxidase maturation protein
MNEATIALIIMSVLILLIFVGFLIWGIKSGQFKGVEDAKYQVFKSDESIAKEMKTKSTESFSEGEKKC